MAKITLISTFLLFSFISSSHKAISATLAIKKVGKSEKYEASSSKDSHINQQVQTKLPTTKEIAKLQEKKLTLSQEIRKWLGETPEQWSTGPLYAMFPAMEDADEVFFEPYMMFTSPRGDFGPKGEHLHTENQRTFTQYYFFNYGITDRLTLSAYPQWSYSWGAHQKSSSNEFGDLPINFEYRLTPEYDPSLTFYLGATIPTGKYSGVHNAANAVGSGVWAIHMAMVGYFSFPIFKHAFNVYFWGEGFQPVTHAHLHGLSSYDTDEDFHGKAKAGGYGDAGISFEYGINQNWVLALDTYQTWSASTTVLGQSDGEDVYNRSGWSTSYNLGPAFEYNFNENLGLLCGVIIPIIGHNITRDLQPQMAISSVF